MVFSSIPSYLDPSNWHQQHHQQQQQNQAGFHHGINYSSNVTNPNPLLPPPPLPPPQHPRAQPPPQSGSIRPGSMAERARMANIPMPEMSLKCPRCDSTNTKFCYFNNYSLSQPRHFCKTCRRYWTRGGALRSVPVGGGCRRNKRSSKSRSSSKTATTDPSSCAAGATSSASSGMSAPTPHHASVAEMTALMTSLPPGLSNLRFMSPPPLHHHHHHLTSEFGEPLGLTSYELGSMTYDGAEQWRIPPPFLLDGSSGTSLYGNSFEGVEFSSLAIGGSTGGPVRSKAGEAVKAEERDEEMSLMRRFNMGINSINDSNQGSNLDEENHNSNWGGGSGSGIGRMNLSAINDSYPGSNASAL